MRLVRLELTRLSTRASKTRMATNYITTAFGATDRTRTGTRNSRDFKSLAATNYATVALFFYVSTMCKHTTHLLVQGNLTVRQCVYT